jgi:plasmid stabilization system protein ParE
MMKHLGNMEYKAVWLAKALEEIDEIYEYYYERSPKVADKMFRAIHKQVKYLEKQPYLGAIESLLEGRAIKYRSLVTSDGLFKICYYYFNTLISVQMIAYNVYSVKLSLESISN